MIACLLFLNNRGDVILSRQFRDCLPVRTLADNFRTQLLSHRSVDQFPPVNVIQGLCYLHIAIGELFLVMVSKSNLHCIAAMQYGIRLIQALVAYFKRVEESILRDNFIAVLEIIDESMDFGYPMVTDADAFKQFITASGIDRYTIKDLPSAEAVTTSMTGTCPWRASGLVYHVNEMFVDVLEEMNMLLSREGEVLNSSVVGKVLVKDFLTGMPQCELLLNTKVFGEGSGESDSSVSRLEGVAFHSCVRLNRHDEAQKLCFVPPDGEFMLMSYKSSVDVSPPLTVVSSRFEEVSSTRTEMQFTLRSEFSGTQVAEQVRLFIPCPENTATVSIRVGKGKAKYVAPDHVIVWKLSTVGNGEEITFAAETKQIAPTAAEDSAWDRPPIRMEFEFLSESLTGLRITALPVVEPAYGYETRKWIRYKTQAGNYQCRIASNEKVRG
eukprot:gene5234-3748_t